MDDEQILVIDNELRTITIPSGFILGVYNDKDTHSVKFQAPSTFGSYDLSTFTARINFENALGEGYQYEATDLKKEFDSITFTWLVGREAYRKSGNVKFVVCLVKKDSSGNITNEFNTTVASAPVLQGYEGVAETSATSLVIYPGTTPDIVVNIDPAFKSKVSKARFDFTQNGKLILQTSATIDSTRIHHVFTQAETFEFKQGTVKMQVHGKNSDNTVWKTKVFNIAVGESLSDTTLS